jgi:hypothetical protein
MSHEKCAKKSLPFGAKHDNMQLSNKKDLLAFSIYPFHSTMFLNTYFSYAETT